MSSFQVDRLAAIIKPTAKMLVWQKSLPGASEEMTLHNLRRDCSVLLIPAFTGPQHARNYIKSLYEPIFENELRAWSIPEEQWPEPRTYDMFCSWFEIEFHSMIYDLAGLHGDKAPLPSIKDYEMV